MHFVDQTVRADERFTAAGDLAVCTAVFGVVGYLNTMIAGEVMVAAGRMARGVLIGEKLSAVSKVHFIETEFGSCG